MKMLFIIRYFKSVMLYANISSLYSNFFATIATMINDTNIVPHAQNIKFVLSPLKNSKVNKKANKRLVDIVAT